MKFVLDLFRWFVSGSSDVEESVTPDHAPAQPATPQKTKSHPFNTIDFDLKKGANIAQFLSDIRSIEPISKQFSKAREELLDELKKLNPRREN